MSSNKEVLKLAIPNILSNITVPLLGIVDTALMGHEPEIGAVLIGAIGLGGIVFNAIYWNFGFLRMGTTGLAAQAYGAKDDQEQALTLFRALSIGLILGILLLILSPFIADVGFGFLSRPENEEIIGYSRIYFETRILAVPAVMCLFGLRGWFFGMQNSVYPLVLLVVVSVINIIGSLVFVRMMGMGVKGVALGTVIAQYLTLGLAIFLLLKKYRWIFKYLKGKLIIIPAKLFRFFFVNTFIFIRTVMLFLVFAGFSFYSSLVGTVYFAVNQILLEMFYLMAFAVDGFAYAAESLVGKYFGARDWKQMQSSIRRTMYWGLGFGLLYAILYLVAGKSFVWLFTSEQEVINSAGPYMIWLAAISVIGSIAFIWDGVYGGATLVIEMAVSMTLATICFFIFYFWLRPSMPEHAIWLAMTMYMLARGLGQWLLFNRFAKLRFTEFKS